MNSPRCRRNRYWSPNPEVPTGIRCQPCRKHRAPAPPVAVAVPVAPAAGTHPAAVPAALPAHRSKSPSLKPPSGVRAAGVIWMLWGGLGLLSMCVLMVTLIADRNTPVPDPEKPGNYVDAPVMPVLIMMLIPLLIDIYFLRMGFQAYHGTIQHLRLKGWACIFLAMVPAAHMFLMSTFEHELYSEIPLIHLLLSAAFLLLLFLAGVMAIGDNARLQRWRAARQGRVSRRPPARP